jgi:hypothetical protein
MQAWAGLAIAQAALIALSLWRLSNLEGRKVWWPGAVMFTIAALSLIVLVRGEGYWTAIAIFGTVVLASDALLLKGQLAAALCTRADKDVET